MSRGHTTLFSAYKYTLLAELGSLFVIYLIITYLQIRDVVASIRADSELEALVILDLKGPGHGDFDGTVPRAFHAVL